MRPAEIGYRAFQSAQRQLRKIRAARSVLSPPLAPSGPPHRVTFFDIELGYPGREPLDWSRDYRSGRRAPLRFYGDIDYRNETQVGDSKYIWELNRHQFLVPWALEFQRTRDERHAQAVAAIILDWIAANPRYVGINWVSSLEMALRTLSWGIAVDLCADSSTLAGVRARVAASVADQATFIRNTLSRYSSANNHLMGELTGLLAAGAFFPEGARCRRYAEFALPEIAREAERQNFPDGVNREGSIYYHHYTLEYLMTTLALTKRLGWAEPPGLRPLVHRMLEFIDAMTDAAGQPFAVGDNDDGAVTGLNLGTGVGVFESLLWSGWMLFGDDALGAHAARIASGRGAAIEPDSRSRYWHGPNRGVAPNPHREVARRLFPHGGYFISTDGVLTLLFKAGPFGYPSIAAHSHCDQLSVCLKRASTVILGDCGTFVYHTDDRWRRAFRGTSFHNTVGVDGVDQAEYAGPFLWATHANGQLVLLRDEPDAFEVVGRHDGYLRLSDPVEHERTVAFRAGIGYRVEDRLRGTAAHRYELYWNLGVDVSIQMLPDFPPGYQGWVVSSAGEPLLTLIVGSPTAVKLDVYHGDEARPAGFESPRYLMRRPVHHVRVTVEESSTVFTTYIVRASRSWRDIKVLLGGWS
jgi:Heparinase II/III-like protein/Heparinase II/III N-terminus